MKLTDPELIAAITSRWHGERDSKGRPLVPDTILERMESVTTEEAWEVLDRHGYQHNFAGDWTILCPERVLVGRAITCRWVPLRPELHETVINQGEAEGGQGSGLGEATHQCPPEERAGAEASRRPMAPSAGR